MTKFHIVGAGISGAVLARQLVEACNCRVTLFEQRNHIAGNCHVERDEATDVLVHVYGPHIFNTNSERVWKYVNRFCRFHAYVNRVKARVQGSIYSLPINLHTINQFFGSCFSPLEAEAFIASRVSKFEAPPKNFEEMALASIGKELYESFIYGYTKKQWGAEPRDLPAGVFKRLPIRYNYDDNYYASRYQGIPVEGYTVMVERILKHSRISVQLQCPYESRIKEEADYLFYTGPLDSYFNFALGRLNYRTVYWERFESDRDIQGVAVMNYPEEIYSHTRISEHNHFSPWETHSRHVAFKEFSKETSNGDTPYYPMRLPADSELLGKYWALAANEDNVSFLGRLGTYRYLNMDGAILQSLNFSARFIGWWISRKGKRPIIPIPPPGH